MVTIVGDGKNPQNLSSGPARWEWSRQLTQRQEFDRIINGARSNNMGVLQENTSGGQSGKNKREFQRKQVTPQAIYVNCILYNWALHQVFTIKFYHCYVQSYYFMEDSGLRKIGIMAEDRRAKVWAKSSLATNHMPGSPKHFRGCRFYNNEEVEMTVHEWLRMQKPDFRSDGILNYGFGHEYYYSTIQARWSVAVTCLVRGLAQG